MKAGEKIYVTTYYELLNRILGTNYKNWMTGIRKISDDCYIWMISIDGVNRGGWVNNYLGENIITEEYVDGLPYPGNINMGVKYKQRLVFDKIQGYGGTKYFVFRGLYELTNEGNFTYRVLRKVSDETDLF